MKKIGFVTPWYGPNIPGGAEMELRGLIKHLQQDGVELEVLATCIEKFGSDWSVNYYPEGVEDVDSIQVRRFPATTRNAQAFDAINQKMMYNIPVTIEEEDVFLHEMVNCPQLYQYMREHQEEYSLFVFIPYMFSTTYEGIQVCPHKSVMIPCFHDESYAYMERFREVFPKVKGMIFHSEPEKQIAERLYDLSNVNAQVLGGGLDTSIRGDAERFWDSLTFKHPFILYAGRKDPGKNIYLLMEYFAKYKEKYHEKNRLKLILIGGGDVYIPPYLREEILDFGFVSAQEKLDACAAAVMLCQPSVNESFSLVIMESWLNERPVLVHDKCAVTKNFANETGGGLYFANYDEFEACVEYIMNNPETANQMGRQGREYVVENFSWASMVRKYKNYFEQVANE